MDKKYLIFPILFCIGVVTIPLYKALTECNGVEEFYKSQFNGRLVKRYIINSTYTHLVFYSNKDSIEPSFGSYNEELKDIITVGDSICKLPYSDSCFVFKKVYYPGCDSIHDLTSKNYHWKKKIPCGSFLCPCEKSNKIYHKLDSLRQTSAKK